ncbi:hypothetical protein CH375_11940 [Leptospira ellisii]|uniref:Uncharacterized protein n=1 Tax=Leptospira ellisii TaxID=2023197 RepID=A0A2N0B925_9LEPT|nr:hypothetical protein CH379_09815 [Leptospira ellisii]PKA04276.1 hypothetical protein CH375_11940 [Leptospira ellisii]
MNRKLSPYPDSEYAHFESGEFFGDTFCSTTSVFFDQKTFVFSPGVRSCLFLVFSSVNYDLKTDALLSLTGFRSDFTLLT